MFVDYLNVQGFTTYILHSYIVNFELCPMSTLQNKIERNLFHTIAVSASIFTFTLKQISHF